MSRKRVLIVEDEFAVGLDIQRTLSEAGFDAMSPVPTIEEALHAAERDPFDAAVIDANLNGQNSAPVASALMKQRVPFVVVSGYTREFLPLALADAPLILKPFEPERLVAVVDQLCGFVVARRTLAVAKQLR